MKLLMISGDRRLVQGIKAAFYSTLEEFHKYWERIDIICPGAKAQNSKFKTQKLFDNVYIHSSSWPLIFQSFFILKKGLEIYRKEKFDLMTVHEYPPFYNGLGARWLSKKTGVPYLLEFHHIIGYPKAPDFREWFYRLMTKCLAKWDAKKAVAVRVVNSIEAPRFLTNYGVPKEKVKFIPSLYLDFRVFNPRNLKKEYDLVFCGRLVENKGIFLLLEAVKKIKKEIPVIKLVIVGTGPLEKKIKSFIKKNKLEENIIFRGWVNSSRDVARIYNKSRIFVMASFNEGGPRVTVEAMACGIPVLTTKVGVMNDLIKDGKNGIFIDWDIEDIAGKILYLLKNDSLRGKMALREKESVRFFSKKIMIKNYASKLKSLLPSKS